MYENILKNLNSCIILKDKIGNTIYKNKNIVESLFELDHKSKAVYFEKQYYHLTVKKINEGTLYIYDLTTRYKNKIEKLKRDQLTNLLTRHAFLEEIDLISKDKSDVAVILGDIDFFKIFNDTYGHLVGDLVLKEVANIISKNIRSTDIAGRYGGEEFIIVLNNASKNSVFKIIERIRQEIEVTPIVFENETLSVTITFGICMCKSNKILKSFDKADKALYKGKNQGRNQTIFYK